jgi:hypothetical protein
MKESIRYKVLTRRLKQLRHRMLPRIFSPTGTYSDLQLDRTRGYRLLVHAEIESFLEERASEVVNTAFNSWRADLKPRHTITCLVAFCRVTDRVYGSAAESVGNSFATFSHIIRHNHGIKEEDLLRFLLPAGVDRAQMDATWLSTISSFGTARGELAHSSVRAHQPIDPKGEYEVVMQKILPGLRDLDAVLQKLLN